MSSVFSEKMRGETMGIHACFIAVLLGVSSAGAGEWPTSPGVLIAADPVLEDVEQLAVVLATGEAGQVGPMIDAPGLRIEVVKKLNAAGIRLVENEAALDPRLTIRIESVAVPRAGAYVCRVQAALDRVVTISGRKDVQAQAQVWRARPALETVDEVGAGKAVAAAVLAQVEVFIAACQSAHQSLHAAKDDKRDASASDVLPPAAPQVENLPLTPGYACVASKGGSVFHRPTCRLVRRIAAGNLINYRSRQDALQAGLRPCKSCKP
jgi:hypothetical protein